MQQKSKKIVLMMFGFFAILILILIGRSFLVPEQATMLSHLKSDLKINIDIKRASKNLAKLISIPTITNKAKKEFIEMHDLLSAQYPRLHKTLKLRKVNQYSLLYHWPGSNKKLPPILFLAHMDVVKVGIAEQARWQHPAFSGFIDKHSIWGRGALDDKAAITSLFESLSYLLKMKFKPKRSIYIALGHDEESGGRQGAVEIRKLLEAKKIKPLAIFDEWSGVFAGNILKVNKAVALVAVAEKGYLTVSLEVEGETGHSSKPPRTTAIDRLSRAIAVLNRKPMPARLTEPVKTMFERMANEMDFSSRLVIANTWLLESLLLKELTKQSVSNALVRTTFATTVFKAGDSENQLPLNAKALINVRLLPGIRPQKVIDYIKKLVNDPLVKLSIKLPVSEASAVSSFTSPLYRVLETSIKQEFEDALVVPGLLIGASDSRHYHSLGSPIYRFRAFRLNQKDIRSVHGINERISIKNLAHSIRFYVRLLLNIEKSQFMF